jgi:excisionase family DNA binding protein
MPSPKHPAEADLTVSAAARVLGVHPNTVRAWSDDGRLPYLRINARGDRRYRMTDLAAFLQAAEQPSPGARGRRVPGHPGAPHGTAPSVLPLGAAVVEERTRPTDAHGLAAVALVPGTGGSRPHGSRVGVPAYARLVRRPGAAGSWDAAAGPPGSDHAGDHARRFDDRRQPSAVVILTELIGRIRPGGDPKDVMAVAVELLHDRAGHDLVAILERRGDSLEPRLARGVGASRLGGMAATRALPARALAAGEPAVETAPPPHVEEWLAPGRLLHGRIAAPIGMAGSPPWGILIVADEGSAAAREWAWLVGSVARLLGIALHVGTSHHEPSGLPGPLRAIQSLGARLTRTQAPGGETAPTTSTDEGQHADPERQD